MYSKRYCIALAILIRLLQFMHIILFSLQVSEATMFTRYPFVALCFTAVLLHNFHPHANVLGVSWTLQKASFVPPAAVIQKRPDEVASFLDASVQCGRRRTLSLTQLSQSKKKATVAPVKKIQVKMLKYMEGTGHVGEIVLVTPAFFNNKLRPTSSAVIISDEQVAQQRADADLLEQETNAKASALRDRLTDLSLRLRRKAGPEGHLFGGIGPKALMDELHKVLEGDEDDFLNHKGVKVTSITDSEGNDMRGDIKHTGEFRVNMSLTKDITASFGITVETES